MVGSFVNQFTKLCLVIITEVPVRLNGARSNYSGRVEVFYTGRWGRICPNKWDIRDARVICHQLGFKNAIAEFTGSDVEDSKLPFLISGVDCFGFEPELASCARIDGEVDCDDGAQALCEPLEGKEVLRTEKMAMNIGATETFHCTLNETTLIRWYNSTGQELHSESGGRIKTFRDGKFTIENVKLCDGGTYTCKGLKYMQYYTIYVNARFTNKHPHQTLVFGTSGILNCSAEGNPAPRFTWTRTDGKTLDKNRFKQLPNGNMHVIQVQQIDEGQYICAIEQSKGTKQTTSKRQRIDVFVIVRPQVKLLGQTALTRREGDMLNLTCIINAAKPKPQVSWYKNGALLVDEEGTNILVAKVSDSDEGLYMCEARNTGGVAYGIVNFTINEKPTSEIIPKQYPTLMVGDPLRLTCRVNRATLQITWMKNGDSKISTAQIGPRKGDESTLYIDKVVLDDSGNYSCKAQNGEGTVSSTVKITVSATPESGGSLEWYYIAGPIFASIFIICTVGVGCYICKCRRSDFTSGSTTMANNDQVKAVELQMRSENMDKWEITRDRIVLKEAIGHGAFGAVWRARLSQPGGKLGIQTVAVKCFTPTSGEEGRKALMREIELGKLFGETEQPNIIKFIGCVTTEGYPIMVMEYLALGDLLGLLRKSRGVHDKYHLGEGSIEELGIYDLVSFAKQIATGMVFLGSRGIIHRDLAARNVLVDKHYICKVTDFGLAYQTFKYGHGNAKKGCIPVKWTAPEILFGNIADLSPLSDVWSYGIVLYEIFTIGGIPYPDWSEAKTIVEIKQGYKMPKPPHVDKALYDIMVRCWNINPDFRPSFENLRKRMESYIRDTTYLELINMDEYDSSKYAKVEDLGGEDIKENQQDVTSSGKKFGERRCASVRQ